MTALVAVDWGTSSFRAWALDGTGEVLAESRAGTGILGVVAGEFETALDAALADLLPGDAPVILSGMITSRNGWVETPYMPLPLDPKALASGLVQRRGRTGRRLAFVPGAIRDLPGGAPDVMRGEETEIAGHIASGAATGLILLPGTHTKLARIEDSRLADFRTCMTGELFALLCDHSILGRLAEPATGAPPGPDFHRGFEASGGEGPLAARIFSARTLVLTGQMPAAAIRDYLSGMLIGDELRGALTGARQPVTIVGRGDLADRYAFVLEWLGWPAIIAPEGRARRGLFDIAMRAGLLK